MSFYEGKMPHGPSLNALRSFSVAGRLKSFTAAARELNVTQGAVSRMVQSLEYDLGIKLFARKGRMIELMPEAVSYHAEVTAALKSIDKSTGTLLARLRQKDTPLSMIVNAAFAQRWLLPHLSSFHRRNPSVRIEITGTHLDPDNKDPDVLASIQYGKPPWPGMIGTRILAGSIAMYCAPQLLQPNLTPQEVIAQPVINHTKADLDHWQEFYESLGLPSPNVSHARKFHQLGMIIEAAVSGMGFALLPQFLIKQELQDGKLIQALPHIYTGERSYYLLYEPGADCDKKVEVFKHWILTEIKEEISQLQTPHPDTHPGAARDGHLAALNTVTAHPRKKA